MPDPKTDVARLYFQICRVDKERREVWGIASTEEVGVDGKIMGFDATCRAMTRWHDRHLYRAPDGTMVGGNIREQHSLKPVAGAIGWMPDPEKRLVYLGSRVSLGAEDTWQKILDGTLRGYSINGPVHQAEMRTVRVGDRERKVPYATEYDLDEISYVDRPGDRPALFTQIIRSFDEASGATASLVSGDVDDGALETPALDVLRAAPAFEGAKCAFCQGPAKGKGDKSDCSCDKDCGESGCPKAESVTRVAQDASSGNEPETVDSPDTASCPFCMATRQGKEGAEAPDASDCTCRADCGQPRCKQGASAVVRADGTHAAMVGEHTHAHAGYEMADKNPNAPHNHKHKHGTQTDGDGNPIPDANHGHDHADAHAVTRADPPLPSLAATEIPPPTVIDAETDLSSVDFERLRRSISSMPLTAAEKSDMLAQVTRAESVEAERVARAAADIKTDERKVLADKGQALDDGSYPIPDVKHLESAIILAQSGHGDVEAAKRLIIKRAGELGAEDKLPDDWKPKVTRADDGTEPTAASEMAQVKQASAALAMLKELLAGEATENDPDDDALGGNWDIAELAKAIEHLSNFVSSETWEATQKQAAAMRSADSTEQEDDLMGAAEDILAKLGEIQTTTQTLVERVEKLETGQEETVTRSADVVRAELTAAQQRVEELATEVKRLGDQPAGSGRLAQPIRMGEAIPQDRLWPGETPETMPEGEQIIRAASVLADEAKDPLVRGRARMELVQAMMRDVPETFIGEPRAPAERPMAQTS
jgi:hypothetical protein